MQLNPKVFAVLCIGLAVSACSNELNVCVKFDNIEPTSVQYEMCDIQTNLLLNSSGLWENESPITVCEGLGKIEFLEGGVTQTLDTPYVPSTNVAEYLTVNRKSGAIRTDLMTSEFGKAGGQSQCTMEKFR